MFLEKVSVLLMALLMTDWTVVAEGNDQLFCSNWTDLNETEAFVYYAVPIFASNPELAKYEAKNVYDLSISTGNVFKIDSMVHYELNYSIVQYRKIATNCFYIREIEFRFKNGDLLSNRAIDTRRKQEKCTKGYRNLPKFELSYILRKDSMILLISCDEKGRNVTILVSCFKYWDKTFNQTRKAEEIIGIHKIENFGYHRVYDNIAVPSKTILKYRNGPTLKCPWGPEIIYIGNPCILFIIFPLILIIYLFVIYMFRIPRRISQH